MGQCCHNTTIICMYGFFPLTFGSILNFYGTSNNDTHIIGRCRDLGGRQVRSKILNMDKIFKIRVFFLFIYR